MRVICAWCKTVLEPGDGTATDVSHGMCQECSDKLEAEADAYMATRTQDNGEAAKA